MVREGYKQTEIGVIPVEWEVFSVEELIKNNIIDKPLDGNHGNIHPKGCDYVSEGIPFIMASDIINGKVDLTTCYYIRKSQADTLQKGFSLTGDVLLTHKGTVGNTAIVPNLNVPYLMLTPQVTYYRVKEYNVLSNYYLRYSIDGKIVLDQILSIASSGATRAYIGITQQRSLYIPIPSLAEQEAIAEALSDTDEWIDSLEQLIAKKRLIKQGAMQELLTPKEGWEEVVLDNIVVQNGLIRGPFGGALKKESFVNQGYKVYEQKNAIYKTVELGKYYVERSKFEELKRFEVLSGDFILSCSGTIGKIFQIPVDAQKGIINQALLIMRLDSSKIFSDYFSHIFQSNIIQNKIIDDTQGGAMKNLVGMIDFRQTKIPKPTSLQEQERIATILSDMDIEIEQLGEQLDKAKQIKQGMMQELLTGRVRLVPTH